MKKIISETIENITCAMCRVPLNNFKVKTWTSEGGKIIMIPVCNEHFLKIEEKIDTILEERRGDR